MARKPLIFSLLMAFWLLCPSSGAEVRAQQELMIIENQDVFKKIQRPSVNFFHERHSEIYPDCTACHHNYQYENGVRVNEWKGEPQQCSQCHTSEKEGRRPALKEAFHRNCTGCHSTLIKAGSKSGPATCGECHVREQYLHAPHNLAPNGPTACRDCHIQGKGK